MLSPDKISFGSGARQMSNQGVKHCQANDGADNIAENDVQCAREEHEDSICTFPIIMGDPEGFR